MSRAATASKLEPLAGPVTAVVLAHVLLGILLWTFLPLWKKAQLHAQKGSANTVTTDDTQPDWKRPEDFLLNHNVPAVAAPVSAPAQRAVITLSSVTGQPGPGMAAVDHAVQQAYLKAWTPSSQSLTELVSQQVNASLEIAIARDGTIISTKLIKASGSAAFDASIQKAANELKKISVSLPATHPNERYDLRVNFQFE